jgi:hypothetical protein
MAKEAVNAAYENTLQEGVLFERRVFHSTFATVSLSFIHPIPCCAVINRLGLGG